jgi:hemoglobin-like flavoprotein
MTEHPVMTSLALVSERSADLTPFVYARLFAEHPEMKPLFWRDANSAVKGEMLARVFDVILDYVGENSYAAHMIQCEIVTHAGYDVPPAIFGLFFHAVAATVREHLGSEWTDEFDAAWHALLADFDRLATLPDHAEAAAAH